MGWKYTVCIYHVYSLVPYVDSLTSASRLVSIFCWASTSLADSLSMAAWGGGGMRPSGGGGGLCLGHGLSSKKTQKVQGRDNVFFLNILSSPEQKKTIKLYHSNRECKHRLLSNANIKWWTIFTTRLVHTHTYNISRHSWIKLTRIYTQPTNIILNAVAEDGQKDHALFLTFSIRPAIVFSPLSAYCTVVCHRCQNTCSTYNKHRGRCGHSRVRCNAVNGLTICKNGDVFVYIPGMI